MNIELGSLEWKKNTKSHGLGKQQVKNARTNKGYFETIGKKIGMDDGERMNLFVLGMDWIGKLIIPFISVHLICYTQLNNGIYITALGSLDCKLKKC